MYYDPGLDKQIEQAAIMLRVGSEAVLNLEQLIGLADRDFDGAGIPVRSGRIMQLGADARCLMRYLNRRRKNVILRRETREKWEKAGRPFFSDSKGGLLTIATLIEAVRRIRPNELRLVGAPVGPARRLRAFLIWYLRGKKKRKPTVAKPGQKLTPFLGA